MERMPWSTLVEGVISTLDSDEALSQELDGRQVILDWSEEDDEDLEIPTVRGSLVDFDDDFDENHHLVVLQFDVFAHGIWGTDRLQTHLHRLLVRPRTYAPFGETFARSTLLEMKPVPDPEPGVIHTYLRLSFEVIRTRL